MSLVRSFMCRPTMATGFKSPSASVRTSISSDVRVKPKLKGVVFDMDGTLTVPAIDFPLMKRMVLGDDHVDVKSGNTSRIDILHQIEQWSPDRQQKAYSIITDFERQAHERLQIMPGALELCEFLDSRQIRRGLITRNIKESVDLFHLRFGMKEFSPSLSREFRPYKPHPAPLIHICTTWAVSPSEVMMVGDSVNDDGRDHLEIGGEDVGSLMNADIGTELGSLRSFGAKGKALVEKSGGHAFKEFDVELSPREGPSGK